MINIYLYGKNLLSFLRGFLLPLVVVSSLYPQEVIDGVAAVVGDNIILKSELADIVFRSILELQLDQSRDADRISELQNQMLQTLINQKIILEIAEIETIEVQDREVDLSIDQYMNSLINQYGTEERVSELAGKSVSEIRREFWPNMREQLITQRFQEQLLADISVTRNEVITFFEQYKDSLEALPTLFNLSHILFNITPGKASKDEALHLMQSLRERVQAGEGFAELASTFSHDPGSSRHGGELGLVSRGTFVPEFEEVAFYLKPGETSDIVETEFGFHIIQLVEKRGEKINVRHILISPQVSEADEDSVYSFALSLRDSILEEDNFVRYAKKYSDDSSTRDNGGNMGWISLSNLTVPEISTVLPSLTVDEISPPIYASDGYHLLFIHDIKPGGIPTLASHWSEIENLSLNKKKVEFFTSWLDQISSSLYIKNFLVD